MKIKRYSNFFILAVIAIYLTACVSSGSSMRDSRGREGGITALGAIGGRAADAMLPMYSGNGGSNIALAVLPPDVHGEVPAHLPLLVQGLLNNIFNRYTAIRIIDRQNLARVVSEQNLAASGLFSQTDFVTIGNMTNAQYSLFGTIQRTSSGRYSLQLSITELGTGIRRATFINEGTLAQFEGRGVLM